MVLSILVAGLVGVVLAQDTTPPPTDLCPFGEACGGYGYAGSMPTLLAEALGTGTCSGSG